MDGDSTLMLDKNEKTVRWVLDRLRQDNTRKASTLAIYQAVPVYYTASAVKQSGTMTATKRDALIVDSYEKFVAPAFVKFLQDNYEFQAPEWLTMGLMGQTTLSGTVWQITRVFRLGPCHVTYAVVHILHRRFGYGTHWCGLKLYV